MKNITEQYWNEIKPLSAIVNEFNVIDGKIKTVDPAHVCMIWIDSYLPDGYYNIEKIPALKAKDNLYLECTEFVINDGEMVIKNAYSETINDKLSTPRLGPMDGLLKTLMLNVDIVTLSNWVKKVYKLSDHVIITSDIMNVTVAYESDSSNGKINLINDMIKTFGESRTLFPMDYIHSFLQKTVTKQSDYKMANIKMGTNVPICLESGRLRYFLAPRIEND